MITNPMKNSSINIFQKGVSLNTIGEIEFPKAIKEIFIIFNEFIFVCFRDETIVFKLINDRFNNCD